MAPSAPGGIGGLMRARAIAVVAGMLLAGTASGPVTSAAEPDGRLRATTVVHCDTDKLTSYVKKGKSRKVKVTLVARGCVEHTTEADGTTSCSRVLSIRGWTTGSKVTLLDKKVRGKKKFRRANEYTNKWTGCPTLLSYLERSQDFGAGYTYPVHGTDLQALPVINVRVRGSEGGIDRESVLKLNKRGSWKFKPMGLVSASP